MTTTVEYLDALKAKTGAPSDYALYQILGVAKSTISHYRNGKTYFDDETCLKVASLLEVPPFEVLLNVHAERSKNPQVKDAFRSIFERLGGVAATLLLATTVNAVTPSSANAGAVSPTSSGSDRLYIMLN